MPEPRSLDIERLRSWIGREESTSDTISPELVRRFNAAFDIEGMIPSLGDGAPLLINYCLIWRLREANLKPGRSPRCQVLPALFSGPSTTAPIWAVPITAMPCSGRAQSLCWRRDLRAWRIPSTE